MGKKKGVSSACACYARTNNDITNRPSSINISIIGQPNVGKSTFFNTLFGSQRSIVSDIAGTTRDAIEGSIQVNEITYNLIDTAGIRSKHQDVIDKYSQIRTETSITNADVSILICDARVGMNKKELSIARKIHDNNKPFVLFFNKWDLVNNVRKEHCIQDVKKQFKHLGGIPMIIGSAKTNRNVTDAIQAAEDLFAVQNKTIQTSELNKFLSDTIQKHHPPQIKGKRLRIYYMIQKSTNPHIFLLFINHKHLTDRNWMRYFTNQLRDVFNLNGVPITVLCRKKTKKEDTE